MVYIELADMPVMRPWPVIEAPPGLDQPSRWHFDDDYEGDAWHQGEWDGYGFEYVGMYPLSHRRLADGETPGYHGAGMGELPAARGAGTSHGFNCSRPMTILSPS